MKKIIVMTAALTLAACAQNPASSLSSVGALAGAAGVPGVNGGQGVNAGPLVQKLNESMLNMSMAQKHTFEAFGLKHEAEQAASDAKAYGTGNSIDAEVLNRTSAADAKVGELIAKNQKISAQGKAKLAKAMPYYSKAMLQSAGLGMQMSQAVVSISANPMSLLSGPYKANELITVFTASPKLLTRMTTTTRNLATYASANGVDTKEVNSNLKDLK